MTEGFSKNMVGFFKRTFTDNSKIHIINAENKQLVGNEYTVQNVNDNCLISCIDDKGAKVDVDPEETTFYRLKVRPMLGYAADTGEVLLENFKDVSDFIIEHGMRGNVEVYTLDTDEFVLNTYGIYLNRISNMDYRTELLAVLVPMQQSLERRLMGIEDDESESNDNPVVSGPSINSI